jgi:hypothetical protein
VFPAAKPVTASDAALVYVHRIAVDDHLAISGDFDVATSLKSDVLAVEGDAAIFLED